MERRGRGGTGTVEATHRLQRLVEANRTISAELSLEAVLERVVEAAREILGARYAALGVLGRDGLLQQFVHTGMAPDVVAAIGDLPKGQGVLGALLNDPQPIRLPSIADDPRSVGFPPHHPPMQAFLGVPIRLRGQVYGNLYLAHDSAEEFSAEDEELAAALAASAGTAIANARLYEEAQHRQAWLRASSEITRRLADSAERDHDLLEVIADAVLQLAEADVVSVVLPDPERADTLRVSVAAGLNAEAFRGLRYPTQGSLAWQVIDEERAVIAEDVDLDEHIHLHLRPVVSVTQAMALPLQGDSDSHGAVVVGRIARRPFTAAELDMATGFASQAALALELVDVRSDRERLAVLEDRDRIARDLHEHVVQRLFSAGLRLESAATRVQDPTVQGRMLETIEDLDDTIRRVRTSIFALHHVRSATPSLRATLMEVVDELTPVLGFEPRLVLDGPLDTLADAAAVADIEAVVREALSNIARHAHARSATVETTATDRELAVVVADDGVGLGSTTRRSGLANLRRRAEEHGGTFATEDAPGGGLRLSWRIPSDI